MAKTIEIEDMITVGALAEKLMLPAAKLIAELMKNGVMATVNERIDFDTAQIIVGELDLDVELKKVVVDSSMRRTRKRVNDKGDVRPPVVAVMGHVDHGKTSLLDAIRGSEVTKKEAGGITQHISAYQVKHKDRLITFLDTPGHEAFAALREHGAQLTDVAIIVVAADDGIKPQTIEAIRFAKKAGVRTVVAINKIDKEGVDINRVKQGLAEQDLLVEDWGGDTVAVEVSAKTKQGVADLLDMVLLVADVEELKADVEVPAAGLIIEAHMEKGRGPVAIALVEQGTLKNCDTIIAGNTYAKIRNLEGTDKSPIEKAKPSTPIVVTGFKELPKFGDEFLVVADEKTARSMTQNRQKGSKDNSRTDITGSELLRIMNRSRDVSELPIIIKTDVQGSLKSVVDCIRTLETEEVTTRVVLMGVGSITENDVHMAHTSNAVIYGFNVSLPANIKRIASRDKVPIRLYSVIYELIDDVKQELSSLLSPEVIETNLGILSVKGVFKTTKTEIICGGEVIKGKLLVPALARIKRGKDVIIKEAEITNLKRGSQDTKEVFEGEMCGMNIKNAHRFDIQEGDKIELYTREVVARKL